MKHNEKGYSCRICRSTSRMRHLSNEGHHVARQPLEASRAGSYLDPYLPWQHAAYMQKHAPRLGGGGGVVSNPGHNALDLKKRPELEWPVFAYVWRPPPRPPLSYVTTGSTTSEPPFTRPTTECVHRCCYRYTIRACPSDPLPCRKATAMLIRNTISSLKTRLESTFDSSSEPQKDRCNLLTMTSWWGMARSPWFMYRWSFWSITCSEFHGREYPRLSLAVSAPMQYLAISNCHSD